MSMKRLPAMALLTGLVLLPRRRAAPARAGCFRRRSSGSSKDRTGTRGSGRIRSWTRCRSREGSIVADLGAGGGWFTVRLARRVGPNGRVYAEDVQPQMIEAITRRVRARGGSESSGPSSARRRIPASRLVDAALIVDAYHEMEQPVALLRNLASVAEAAGTHRHRRVQERRRGPGPPMDERIDPERVIRDAAAAGLRLLSRETFLRYQYMLVFGAPSK